MFQNKNLSTQKKLRLFDSYVTPGVLYGLGAIVISQAFIVKLGSTQRKMLRSIIGWVRFSDESWQETGRRMKVKLDSALQETTIQM